MDNPRPDAAGLSQRTWQQVERPFARQRIITPGTAILPQLHDNNAEVSWRSHRPYYSVVNIPQDLAAGAHQEYQEIARGLDSFLFPVPERGRNVFGIWGGTAEQANATRRAIIDWGKGALQPKQSSNADKFGRVHSLTVKQTEKAEKRWLKEVRRQQFRQHPPTGSQFEAIGTFRWPMDEIRPEEALGSSLEALDPVRMDCASYIVIGNDSSTLNVLGNIKDVQAAMIRIRRTFFQITARQQMPTRCYLLYWKDTRRSPQNISSTKYVRADASKLAQVQEMTYHAVRWQEGCSSIPAQSVERIRSIVTTTLKNLHYHCSNLHFRVRLGQFVATSFLQPEAGFHTLQDFESLIMQSQFAGQVTQEIGHKAVEQNALKAFTTCDFLEPLDLMIADLVDNPPTFNADFYFQVPEGSFQLSAAWQESKDGTDSNISYAALPQQWVKLDSDTHQPTQLLDINILRLDSDFAWHFGIDATYNTSNARLPDKLKDFAIRVKFVEAVARRRAISAPFVSFVGDNCGLKQVRCNITYPFRLINSDYVVELTRVQQWDYTARPAPRITESRWRLQLYSSTWDMMLSENSALGIGEKAKWSDDLKDWFPNDLDAVEDGDLTQGINSLLEKLQKVERIVRDVGH